MSTGNQYGLAEISHFGSFQRVGGKAGGFINKKFFHPSSLRNQEKLWKAQTADERESRKQAELQKRRDEERQVEDLQKQMYLCGQSASQDSFVAPAEEEASASSSTAAGKKSEQRLAHEEFKRRRLMLREKEDRPEEADAEQGEPEERPLLKSKFPEDVCVLGHAKPWGSWYCTEKKLWGFACCRGLDRSVACPLAEEPSASAKATAKQAQKGKRRKAGRGNQPGDAAEDEAADDAAAETPKPIESLMDMRMFEAAERRKEQKRLEEKRKAEEKTSSYLSNLMLDPTGD